MRCRAVLCSAVPRCGVLRVLLYLLFRTCQVSFEVSYQVPDSTLFVRTTLSNKKNELPAQLRPAIAQQRSAAPCGAVRCRALSCGAVRCCTMPRCAFFGAYSTTCNAKYQVPDTGIYVYVVLLLSSFNCPLSALFMFVFSQITPILPIIT